MVARRLHVLCLVLIGGCGRVNYRELDAGAGATCAWPGNPFSAPTPIEREDPVFDGSVRSISVNSVALSPDGLTLSFIDESNGHQVYDLHRASLSGPFSSSPVANSDFSFGPDLRSFHVRTDRLERFVALAQPGTGLADLFVQTRASTSDPWSSPRDVLLDGVSLNTADAHEWDPYLSSDGLTLWFQREPTREAVAAGAPLELHRARRAALDQPFGAAETIDVSAAGPSPGSPTVTAHDTAVVIADDQDLFYFVPGAATTGLPMRIAEIDPAGTGSDYEPFIRRDGCELLWVRQGARATIMRSARSP
ncbi:MAG: hypothetical protein K1X94_26590 [Sandaracinaceae bacterium]|nr:hypothetical protein [Sandaracinaceae bacterium]